MSDGGRWNPEQYERFREERLRPARDLVALVEPPAEGVPVRALDLGCGTGEPTELLAARLGPGALVEGVDSSPEMLARAAPRATAGLHFHRLAVEEIAGFDAWDVVMSNAALHWVPDHEALFARLLGTLRPGAQVALQMPFNQEHASHRTVVEVARSEPFAGWLGGFVSTSATLPLARYAELFFAHGLSRTRLYEEVFSHRLDHSADVVEWVKGTTLLPYLSRLDAAQGERFVAAYRERLLGAIGERAPYLFTFRRMFLWGRKGG